MNCLFLALALAGPIDDPGTSAPESTEAEPASDTEAPEGWTPLEIERSPEPTELAIPVQGPNEIIVWGEGAIRHARDAIVREMVDLGYTVHRRKKDGTTIFRPPATWQGRVELYEGMFHFRQPVVAIWVQERDRTTQYDAARTLDGTDAPEATGLRFVVLPARRRLDAKRAKVLEGTRDEVLRYRGVVQQTAAEDLLFVLPDRLDALWADGQRLDGVADPLHTPAARREHVLGFWASRADTEVGDQVRTVVVDWLSATVQGSQSPLTATEIERAEAEAGRSLDLREP